ncbi:MAG: tetraacyldisaccharide 4'-kinase, partial [Ketobacter sp.]
PFERIFHSLSSRRRSAFLNGQSPVFHAPVPVIVVGNISVGGTGKTPLTIWLIEALRERGYTPGVVSRGYGGDPDQYPHQVGPADTADKVGDEPLMIYLRSKVPVVIDPDRSSAVQALLKNNAVDVVISDDGLQHYRLARTVELAVVDGQRGFGNENLLPMGPLREPVGRLKEVDAVVINCSAGQALVSRLNDMDAMAPRFQMHLTAGDLVALNKESEQPLGSGSMALQNPGRVQAVAGIGNPQRFFQTLSDLSIQFDPYPFRDHHRYTEQDLSELSRVAMGKNFIVTTEKDAVKLQCFPQVRGAYLPVNAKLQDGLIDVIMARLEDFKLHHSHRY